MNSAQLGNNGAVNVKRDPFFDTARFGLILLVVVGHSLAYLKADSPTAESLYRFIYAFHMPAFIFLTGYLSRNFVWDERGIRRTVETLIVPAILFETVSQWYLLTYTDESFTYNPFVTQWLGWFLWAMVGWRILTPLFRSLRYPILTSIILSLAAGFFTLPNVVGIPKIVGFLPFYVLGLMWTQKRFDRFTSNAFKAGSAVVMGTGLAVAFLIPFDAFPTTVLLWKRAYSDPLLGASVLEGLAYRTVLLGIGIILTLAYCALVSRRESRFSIMGTRTLYCYLIHGFGVLIAYNAGMYDFLPAGAFGVIVTILVASAWALLLLTKPVSKLFKPLFEPRLGFLFSRDR